MEKLLSYCIEYQEKIFVRSFKDGKWGSYSLAELPFKQAIEHILRWNDEGKIPSRLI